MGSATQLRIRRAEESISHACCAVISLTNGELALAIRHALSSTLLALSSLCLLPATRAETDEVCEVFAPPEKGRCESLPN